MLANRQLVDLRNIVVIGVLTIGVGLSLLYWQGLTQQIRRNWEFVAVSKNILAIQANPDIVPSYSDTNFEMSPYADGLFHFHQGKVAEAKDLMKAAAAVGDHPAQALFRQAEYAYQLDMDAEADEVLNDLVARLSPAQAVENISIACKHGSTRTCVLLYNEILRRIDERALKLQLLGLAIEEVSFRDAAAVQAWAEEGIALSPTSTRFHHELSIALTRQRQYADAVIMGERAKELGDRSTRLDTFLGRAYHGVGEEEVALALLNDVVRREASNADAWFYLGEVYHTLDEIENARMAWQRVIEINPHDARALKALANLDK